MKGDLLRPANHAELTYLVKGKGYQDVLKLNRMKFEKEEQLPELTRTKWHTQMQKFLRTSGKKSKDAIINQSNLLFVTGQSESGKSTFIKQNLEKFDEST